MKNGKKDLLRDERIRQAFAEIERTEAARFAALPDGDPSFSPVFEERMDALLSQKEKPRRAAPARRRVLAAGLAACALLFFLAAPFLVGREAIVESIASLLPSFGGTSGSPNTRDPDDSSLDPTGPSPVYTYTESDLPDSLDPPERLKTVAEKIIDETFSEERVAEYFRSADPRYVPKSSYVDPSRYLLEYSVGTAFLEKFAETGNDYSALETFVSDFPTIYIPFYSEINGTLRVIGHCKLSYDPLIGKYRAENSHKNTASEDFISGKTRDLCEYLTAEEVKENYDHVLLLSLPPLRHDPEKIVLLQKNGEELQVLDLYDSVYLQKSAAIKEVKLYSFSEYAALRREAEKALGQNLFSVFLKIYLVVWVVCLIAAGIAVVAFLVFFAVRLVRRKAGKASGPTGGEAPVFPGPEEGQSPLPARETKPRRAAPARRVIAAALVAALLFVFFGFGVAYAVGLFDKNNHETWYDNSNNKKITTSDLEKIKEGMSFEEVVSIIGKPTKDIGSGAFVMEWNMESNRTLTITFNPAIDSKSEGDLIAYLISVSEK
ncbi:MAG: hypothetical protein IJR89_07540 [Clostridia bacterium]|nr:hypothetical protein [Clostridia bacterium]